MNKSKKSQKKIVRQTSTKMVVYKPQKSGKKSQKAKRGSVPRGVNDLAYARYAAALKNPFSPLAMGARVPDQYSIPTSTFHLKARGTITCASSYGSMLFLPSPLSAMFVDQNVSSMSFDSVTAITGGAVYSCCAQSDLSSVLASYRVVGWGVKLTNLTPAMTASGYLEYFELPSNSYPPMYPAFGASSTVNQVTSHMLEDGGSYSGGAFQGIPNKPGAAYVNVQSLMNQELLLTPRICSPDAFRFATTARVAGISGTEYENIPGEVINIIADTVNEASETRTEQVTGWNGIMMNVGGGPGSSQFRLGVEIIYHLEGLPSQTKPSAPISSGGSVSVVGNRSKVDDIVANVSSGPYWSYMKDAFSMGANFLSNVASTHAGRAAFRGATQLALGF